MPVHSRGFGEVVPEVNDDAISFHDFERGPGRTSVVRENLAGDASLELQARSAGGDRDFDRARGARNILQQWRRCELRRGAHRWECTGFESAQHHGAQHRNTPDQSHEKILNVLS
jgi:hypothetical protein